MQRNWLTFFWPVLILATVAGAATLTYRLVQRDVGTPETMIAAVSVVTPQLPVPAGKDYYLWVRLIEVESTRPDGKKWDTDGSAPDLSFDLFWKSNKLMASPKRSDTLIGKWDIIAADVLEMVRSHKIEIESAIQMPIVHIEPGSTAKIEVFDLDPMYSDSAGTLEVHLDTLMPGVNTVRGPEGSAIKRLEIEAIDVRTPLADLVELVTKR